MFYLIDVDHPNRKRYLSPYKSKSYHISYFRVGGQGEGKKHLTMHNIHQDMHNIH